MATKYKTVVTTAGAAKFAAALTPGGKKVNITTMAVGDGGGALPQPNAEQTKLINEVWRYALNKISQDNKHKNYVVAELVIPPETGGFWLREMGLYDDTGTLVAVGNMAESYKPKLEEGSGRAQTLRMVIILSDVASVQLTLDSSTVMATQDYVDDKLAEHEQSRLHPDASLSTKGFVQLTSATDSVSETLAATAKAVKTINDNTNSRVPAVRKINGYALSNDINITSQDIFNGQALSIGNVADLNAYTISGLYFQAVNTQAANGKNYPVPLAGSLEVYKHAGITQIYRVYNESRSYIRTLFNGVWSAWVKQYDEANKPSAADVSAVPVSIASLGATNIDTLTGTKFGRYIQPLNTNATGANGYPISVAGALDVIQNAANNIEGCTQEYRPYSSNVCYRRYYDANSRVWSEWEYDLTSAGGVIKGFVEITGDQRSLTIKPKTANAGYYFFGRKYDNTNHFYLGQGSGNSDNITWGNYLTNSSVSLVAGGVAVSGAITPSDWSNFDARYQAKGSYTPAGQAYTKAESDARYNLKNAISKAATGWHKDVSTGFITQWGVARRSSNITRIGFATAFPNVCVSVHLSLVWLGGFHDQNIYVQSADSNGFNYIAGDGEGTSYFMAIGY
ncbi:phage tail protein [Cronobacter malonaticus]